jgi:hypothetical protein
MTLLQTSSSHSFTLSRRHWSTLQEGQIPARFIIRFIVNKYITVRTILKCSRYYLCNPYTSDYSQTLSVYRTTRCEKTFLSLKTLAFTRVHPDVTAFNR